ncbi:MAG: hypothetical protein IT459_13100 [Planctomycetes bacterium]|nr:hypothetical protein [Planctomycetota bacterium]
MKLWLVLLRLVVVSAVLLGCVVQREDLVASGGVDVVTAPCEDVELDVYVWEEGGRLTVRGTVESTRHSRSMVLGYVELTVTAPDGRAWATRVAEYHPLPPRRGKTLETRFDATFDGVPPVGSVVRVAHHSSPPDPH